MSDQRTITCVYCGHAYKPGVPAHGHEALTEHIRVCEKHPMRTAEKLIAKLRNALVGLVGTDDPEELNQMEALIRVAQIPESDRVNTINAIDAIREANAR